MSHHHAHIKSAEKAIAGLPPGEPLSHYLKKFFAADKKYGSKDRKAISSLCYCYYRAAHALAEKTTAEKIIASYFLCTAGKTGFLEKVAPDLYTKATWTVERKCALMHISAADIFTYGKELSSGIDLNAYAWSFLRQPFLFLRLRPGKAVKLLEKLTAEKVDFTEVSTSCISMPPASKAQDLFKLNKDVVVQDMNSQQVFSYLNEEGVFHSKDVSVWDCCAASGGKSILLYDTLHGHIDLTVSDIRENILHNLRNRFKDAGVKKYHAFIADLTDSKKNTAEKKYELIICDVPCTGSGTWSRTPEQLHFFDENNLAKYAEQQKKIASAAAEALQPGGLFFYITCSVFKKENEEVVEYLKQRAGLQLLQMKYFKGYDDRADTLFTAVFSR